MRLFYVCSHLLTVSGLTCDRVQNEYAICSKQEGVKVGRPTPYIGAPSEVNNFFNTDNSDRPTNAGRAAS